MKKYREPGFFVEEGIFGGIIGVVFQDERETGVSPRVLEADYTNIDYLFVHKADGNTYRLGES